jgi:hypothetical protein
MGPQDPKETARIVARDLPDAVRELSSLAAEASHLRGTEYATLRFRMEAAHAAAEAALVEARRAVRRGEERSGG